MLFSISIAIVVRTFHEKGMRSNIFNPVLINYFPSAQYIIPMIYFKFDIDISADKNTLSCSAIKSCMSDVSSCQIAPSDS